MIEKGGIQYANKIMNDYRTRAIAVLNQLPENESRHSLERLLNYAIERKK